MAARASWNWILFPYLDEAVRLVCRPHPTRSTAKQDFDDDGTARADRGRHCRRRGLHDAAGVEASPVPQRLAAMVAQGRLGRKSGTGFYAYREGRKQGAVPASDVSPKTVRPPLQAKFGDGEPLLEVPLRLALAVVNASAQSLADRIVRESWIVDLAMVLGTGFAPFRGGPLRLADTWGIDQVVAALDRLAETLGPRFRPCTLLRDMQRSGRKFFETTSAAQVTGAPAAAVHSQS